MLDKAYQYLGSVENQEIRAFMKIVLDAITEEIQILKKDIETNGNKPR